MKQQNTKRRFHRVSANRREELIDSVIKNDKPITYAARKLRIKYSKARSIVFNYRKIHNLPPNLDISQQNQPNLPQEHQLTEINGLNQIPLFSPNIPLSADPFYQSWLCNYIQCVQQQNVGNSFYFYYT